MWRLLLVNNALYHFGLDLKSELVLPKDLRLLLGISHQGADPHRLVLAVLNERVDALRHLLVRRACLYDVFLVGLENPRHFSEVVLVLLHFFRQAGERRSHAFIEQVLALNLFYNLGD